MLRYDARWLMEQYAGETPVHPGVPYMWWGGQGRTRSGAQRANSA